MYITGCTVQILYLFFITYKIFIRLLVTYSNLKPVAQDYQTMVQFSVLCHVKNTKVYNSITSTTSNLTSRILRFYCG